MRLRGRIFLSGKFGIFQKRENVLCGSHIVEVDTLTAMAIFHRHIGTNYHMPANGNSDNGKQYKRRQMHGKNVYHGKIISYYRYKMRAHTYWGDYKESVAIRDCIRVTAFIDPLTNTDNNDGNNNSSNKQLKTCSRRVVVAHPISLTSLAECIAHTLKLTTKRHNHSSTNRCHFSACIEQIYTCSIAWAKAKRKNSIISLRLSIP